MLIQSVTACANLRARPAVCPAIPNFFIVGAARCGTTSLFEALSHHSDVYCCPVKEPNYFALDLTAQRGTIEEARRHGVLIDRPFVSILEPPRVAVTTDYAAYLRLFELWNGQKAVGEASTSYLPSRVAAQEIAGRFPDARIIVILRDPVARAHSEYLMHRQLGRVLGTFREAINPELNDIERGAPDMRGMVFCGFYAQQVKRYLARFRREQILFLLFDELISNQIRVLERVFCHLGVDPGQAHHIPLGWENKSRLARFPSLDRFLLRTGKRTSLLRAIPGPLRHRMRSVFYTSREPISLDPDDRDILLKLFREDIEVTATLINRDLSHWVRRRTGRGRVA
jgi:hypothetical protein